MVVLAAEGFSDSSDSEVDSDDSYVLDEEMNALQGLLVLCCIFKSSRESVNSLFSTGITGRPIFRCILSEKRCHILLRAMRLDDHSTHLVRVEIDPTAPISDIYNSIMKNLMSN
ncbi:hypothetical protein PR048_013588 [Dryococelus australis]|uniref:PiggyBac transposable element-derived protein domain-containing protein n=1 Tax=Dryococelus australis TaxID=614101 RepID=A0ABQ9HSL9_9NEOP|nr:hypothetical protein PR048_013588 [Dryococelus australis]